MAASLLDYSRRGGQFTAALSGTCYYYYFKEKKEEKTYVDMKIRYIA